MRPPRPLLFAGDLRAPGFRGETEIAERDLKRIDAKRGNGQSALKDEHVIIVQPDRAIARIDSEEIGVKQYLRPIVAIRPDFGRDPQRPPLIGRGEFDGESAFENKFDAALAILRQ